MAIKNAEKLVKEVTNKIRNSEYNTVTMKGVRNLSRSDLESAVMYAETYINSGGYSFTGLMNPVGNVKELLDKYDVKVTNDYSW